MSEGEKCAAPRHGRRIAKVLDGTGDATPAHVEKALRDLGYRVEYRVNGPREKNGKVGFTLDLRFMGDLCLTGEYDGSRTTYDAYGASPEVRCTDVKRREK
ncbi:hypothetical protein ASE09_22705 [Streptomyces sp. Root66D1]|nr:hypothetical protein ASD33_25150 [Streptomyces sp. Root1304]KRA78850.1 hypothetical protein ASE09_22705 [Streptomyces sp. Root66D1]